MPRAGLTKVPIAEASLRLIAEAGPGALTARALASRLGEQAASLYNHVESLDAVRAELGQAALTLLDAMIAEGNRSESIRDQLLQTAAAYQNAARAPGGIWRQFPALCIISNRNLGCGHCRFHTGYVLSCS